MITVAIVSPEIPPNTGTIARLCGATNSTLHIVGKPNFDMSDKAVKRAGLDYWHLVDIHHFENIEEYFENQTKNLIFFSTHGKKSYTKATYEPNNTTIVFGSETQGLPKWIHEKYADDLYAIPMSNRHKGMRSINISISCGIALYEALRQCDALDGPNLPF